MIWNTRTGAAPPVTLKAFSTSTSTMPDHSAGDLLIGIGVAYGYYPVTPSGWTAYRSGSINIGSGYDFTLVWKIAASSSETCSMGASGGWWGSFTNGTGLGYTSCGSYNAGGYPPGIHDNASITKTNGTSCVMGWVFVTSGNVSATENPTGWTYVGPAWYGGAYKLNDSTVAALPTFNLTYPPSNQSYLTAVTEVVTASKGTSPTVMDPTPTIRNSMF